MVENPIIASYVEDVLKLIEEGARDQELPILVKKTVYSEICSEYCFIIFYNYLELIINLNIFLI